MHTKTRRNYLKKKTLLLSTALLLIASIFLVQPIQPAGAVTEEELRAATESLEDKIAKNEAVLHGLEKEKNTLQNRVTALDTEIALANQKIQLINQKIANLRREIKVSNDELIRQQGILNDSLVAIYKQGDITTLELLASSDNYTDFINQQEYLERLKKGVQESADEIEALKARLEEEKTKQVELLDSLQKQKSVLDGKRNEQASLLSETRGQEAAYQSKVADLEQQRQEAEEALEAFLAAQSFASLGKVFQGQTIGYVGSTGFSTGPHLHFEVRSGVEKLNPVAGGGSLSYGLQWMLPSSSWANLTQNFGCVAPYSWYYTKCDSTTSFHSGIDVSGWYGDPIVSPGDGDIIYRGWLGGYGNMVLIQHDSGIITAYGHLLE